MTDRSYAAVMSRRAAIVERAVGVDYRRFEADGLAFDYEGLMASAGAGLDEVRRIQRQAKVGETPLLELPRLTRLARELAPPGCGAQLLRRRTRPGASRPAARRSPSTKRSPAATRV